MFGLTAYLMEENGFPVAPAILGMVLGAMLEEHFISSMIKADGRLLEPDAAAMASQGNSDLSQLEPGDYVEQIKPGAFRQTLRERGTQGVKMQFNHGGDAQFGSLPIGVWTTGPGSGNLLGC